MKFFFLFQKNSLILLKTVNSRLFQLSFILSQLSRLLRDFLLISPPPPRSPLRACEIRCQCMSLSPSKAPLKHLHVHSIVFCMLLRQGETHVEHYGVRERERELQWRSWRSKRDIQNVCHVALRGESQVKKF